MRKVFVFIFAVAFCLLLIYAEIIFMVLNWNTELLGALGLIVIDGLIAYTAADKVIKKIEQWIA